MRLMKLHSGQADLNQNLSTFTATLIFTTYHILNVVVYTVYELIRLHLPKFIFTFSMICY